MPNKKIFILILILLFISGCGLGKKRDIPEDRITMEEKQFQIAEKAFIDKEYQEAQRLYKDFINKFKNSEFIPDALLKLAIIQEKDDKDLAFDHFMKIITKYNNHDSSSEASIHAGNILIERENYSEAIRILNENLEKHISDDQKIRILYVKGNAFFHLKEYKKTIDIYWKIHQLDPNQYLILRPLIEKSASRMDQYELLNSSSVFLKPDAIALFKKHYALTLSKEKKFSQAVEVLRDIIETYPLTKTSLESKKEIELIESKNNFKIGCILPLSGKFQAFGEMALKGIQLALSEFTAVNPEIKIKLLLEDNKSEETGSKEAAIKLSNKGVSAIIGPFHTAESAAAVAQNNSIPIMAMTHKPGITKERDFVFRNFITQAMQARALVTYSKDVLKIDSFAILYPDEPYGEKFMDAFWNAADENNCRIMGAEKYDTETTDYSSAIKKLTGLDNEELRKLPKKEEDTELLEEEKLPQELDSEIEETINEEEELESIVDFKAVFIPDGPAKAGSIAPQLAYYDVKDVTLLGPNLWKSQELFEYSEGYLNKAVFTALFYNESSKPVLKRFSDSFEALFGTKPEFVEAVSYDSAMFIFNSAKTAESASPALIKEVIHSTPIFHGVTGSTLFDENGECIKEIMLLEADSSGIREIKQ